MVPGKFPKHAILALCLALAGCGGDTEVRIGNPPPVPPLSASLAVTIAGLPTGAQAAVRVTGPSGYAINLADSRTLTGLEAGTYTVSASGVAANGALYAPSAARQDIVAGGGSTVPVTVRYAAQPGAIGLAEHASGFNDPVFLASPAGDARQFVVERGGRILIIRNGVVLSQPFLDIGARLSTAGEGGLLSMAFDPGYASNGYFYLYFTDFDGSIVVERRSVSGNPDVASATGALTLIRIAHPGFTNHYGGLVAFGPDGLLYLATGDGGGAGDPDGNAQDPGSLLGKMLRLDVSAATATSPYRIPPSNPYANGGGRAEIWGLGLRNPWRFAFDAGTLYIADPGQDLHEEVNIAGTGEAGVNYGWDIMEGTACFNASGCNTAGLRLPAFEYSQAGNPGTCAIIGGYVYRGQAIPELAGHYFYADYCTGFLRSFLWNGTAATQQASWQVPAIANVSSFGQDGNGELYLLSTNGTVYRLVRR